ncbi:MAG: hypothetical protein KBD15_01250 [Candidatus Magasanikbacteria bacterium]|nr:hypothetical protein [Candidatus Magasanikbacteria bacterium]
MVTLCLFTLLYGVFKTTKETYEADASRDDGPPTVGETSSPPVATAIPRFRAPGPATSSMIAFALEPTPRGGGNDLDKVLDEPGTRLVGITHPEGVADVDPLGATLVDK